MGRALAGCGSHSIQVRSARHGGLCFRINSMVRFGTSITGIRRAGESGSIDKIRRVRIGGA